MTKKHLSVLLVEDSKTDAILIRKILGDDPLQACTIEHVTTLASAVRAVGENTFDVVILTGHADEELAFCLGKEDMPADGMVKQADETMYHAKAVSGSNYKFYGEPQQVQAKA